MKTFYTVYNTEEGFFRGCDDPKLILHHGGYDRREAEELAASLAATHPESLSLVFKAVKVCSCTKPQVTWEQVEPIRRFQIVLTGIDHQYLISTIKALREYTNLGLKEAKDTVDFARYEGKAIVSLPETVTYEHLRDMSNMLKEYNATFHAEEYFDDGYGRGVWKEIDV